LYILIVYLYTYIQWFVCLNEIVSLTSTVLFNGSFPFLRVSLSMYSFADLFMYLIHRFMLNKNVSQNINGSFPFLWRFLLIYLFLHLCNQFMYLFIDLCWMKTFPSHHRLVYVPPEFIIHPSVYSFIHICLLIYLYWI